MNGGDRQRGSLLTLPRSVRMHPYLRRPDSSERQRLSSTRSVPDPRYELLLQQLERPRAADGWYGFHLALLAYVSARAIRPDGILRRALQEELELLVWNRADCLMHAIYNGDEERRSFGERFADQIGLPDRYATIAANADKSEFFDRMVLTRQQDPSSESTPGQTALVAFIVAWYIWTSDDKFAPCVRKLDFYTQFVLGAVVDFPLIKGVNSRRRLHLHATALML